MASTNKSKGLLGHRPWDNFIQILEVYAYMGMSVFLFYRNYVGQPYEKLYLPCGNFLCAYRPRLLTLEARSRWKCLGHCFTGCLSTLEDRRCMETSGISVYIQEKTSIFYSKSWYKLSILGGDMFLLMNLGWGSSSDPDLFPTIQLKWHGLLLRTEQRLDLDLSLDPLLD